MKKFHIERPVARIGNYRLHGNCGNKQRWVRGAELDSYTDAYLVSRGMPKSGYGETVDGMRIDRALRGAKLRGVTPCESRVGSAAYHARFNPPTPKKRR